MEKALIAGMLSNAQSGEAEGLVPVMGLVLSAKEYKFTTKEGEVREGVTVYYLPSLNFTPRVKNNPFNESLRTMGLDPGPIKASAPWTEREKFEAVPGVYVLHCRTRIGEGGRLEQRPEKFDFVGLVSLEVLSDYAKDDA